MAYLHWDQSFPSKCISCANLLTHSPPRLACATVLLVAGMPFFVKFNLKIINCSVCILCKACRLDVAFPGKTLTGYRLVSNLARTSTSGTMLGLFQETESTLVGGGCGGAETIIEKDAYLHAGIRDNHSNETTWPKHS